MKMGKRHSVFSACLLSKRSVIGSTRLLSRFREKATVGLHCTSKRNWGENGEKFRESKERIVQKKRIDSRGSPLKKQNADITWEIFITNGTRWKIRGSHSYQDSSSGHPIQIEWQSLQ